MIFILLGFGKVGFCEMFAKRGTLQRSGREVLRERIYKDYNIIFLTNCATLLDLLFTFYCFKSVP